MNIHPQHPHVVRSDISREMAYPVGYELLREHFGTIQEWPEVRFSFRDCPTLFASDFARILREGAPYRILELSRQRAYHVWPDHWHFAIYPVRKDSKRTAREALIRDAFDSLRSFYLGARGLPAFYGSRVAVFDPSVGTCCTESVLAASAFVQAIGKSRSAHPDHS